jgi:hypothetical protein
MRESTTASLRHESARGATNDVSVHQSAAVKSRAKRSAILLALALIAPSVAAQAQTPEMPPPAAETPPPAMAPATEMPPPAMPPPTMAPAPVAPPSAVEASTKPPTSSETMAATRPEVLPPIDVGAWVRAGSIFQKQSDPKSLGDWHMDNSYVELHSGGKIHKNVGVTLNVNANLLAGTAAIEDAIISFDLMEPLHLWVGQLLVPVDRSNFSGPFFMIPWNYPGFLTVGGTTVVAAPKEGPSGRNTGGVVWGQFNEGQFKYLVGAFDNGNANTSPLYSGHLNLAIIGKEPGFWGNASYFGDKDVLAIGVGGQFQKHGSSVIMPAAGGVPATVVVERTTRRLTPTSWPSSRRWATDGPPARRPTTISR